MTCAICSRTFSSISRSNPPRRRAAACARTGAGDSTSRLGSNGETASFTWLSMADRCERPLVMRLRRPAPALAEMLATEWQQQREVIDPASNAADPACQQHHRWGGHGPCGGGRGSRKISRFRSRLLSCRGAGGFGRATDPGMGSGPVLGQRGLGRTFRPGAAIALCCADLRKRWRRRARRSRAHPWRLGARACGHYVDRLRADRAGACYRALSLDEAWTAAHVDEDWNMERWGQDELARERRSYRFGEMRAAGLFLEST